MDRLSRASNSEVFEAIVSQLEDPEVVWLRRIFLVLGAAVYLAGALAVTVLGGLGLPGLVGFSATFLPGVTLACRAHTRRFRATRTLR
ncbi:MAG: hypothetical protein M3163_13675 [Actinomycetota bacterium]|nr:hypothetical protein [Actinomycetota bacterium]